MPSSIIETTLISNQPMKTPQLNHL